MYAKTRLHGQSFLTENLLKVHQRSLTIDKVFDAGLHDQRTLPKKTLTNFFMENFDCANGP